MPINASPCPVVDSISCESLDLSSARARVKRTKITVDNGMTSRQRVCVLPPNRLYFQIVPLALKCLNQYPYKLVIT